MSRRFAPASEKIAGRSDDGDGATVLDHLRVAVHVGRHRTLERDLQLRRCPPSAPRSDDRARV